VTAADAVAGATFRAGREERPMNTRHLRRLFKVITAVGIGALMGMLGVASALANHGPGPWP